MTTSRFKPQFKPHREHLSKAQFKKRAFEVFERDSHICQYCTRPRSEYMSAIHAHHRIFKGVGGDDQMDNLATACYFCHGKHGDLKGRRLISERDDTKINELTQRYRR